MADRPEYKGCGICGEHHHTDYHYVVIVNRLFQVHIKSDCYEEGTQVFKLRQNLRTEWDRCNIAFNADSNCTMVTEAYTARKECKWLGHQAAYV